MFLAEGFEETEAIATLDVLRRGGVPVKTVSVTDDPIVPGAHGIPVKADLPWKDFLPGTDPMGTDPMDVMIFPGGMPGTLNLEKSEAVQTAIDFCAERKIFIAAICAAPSILGHKGMLQGRKAIAYPGFETQLAGAEISEHSVQQDDFILTAQGAGAAVPFGLKLAEVLTSAEKSQKLAEAICYPEH